mmetsp:Transcript_12535/g.39229  ORF Transcript_12535/g.39229 Transcript_12535/m.39229 type:complete len:673 (-) Transcript_12535:137-2155(-)
MFDIDKISDFEEPTPGGATLPDGGQWQHAVEVHTVKEEYAAAMKVAEDSLAEYKNTNNEAGQAAAFLAKAKVLHSQGKNDEALGAAEEALSLSRSAGSKAGEAAALHTLARLHFDVKKSTDDERTESIEQAEKVATEALDAFKSVSNTKGEASVTNTLAKVLFAKGNFDDAVEHADKALRLFAEAEERNGQAAALITKSIIHLFWGAGKWDQAAKFAKEAVALCKKVTKPSAQHREADAWLMICAATIPMSKTSDALEAAKAALSLMETLGGDHKLTLALRALAFTQAVAGNIDEAMAKFGQAIALSQNLADKHLKATLLVTGAIVHRAKIAGAKAQGTAVSQDEQYQGTQLAKDGIALFTELGDEALAALTRLELAQGLLVTGNINESLGEASAAKDFFESMQDKAGEAIGFLILGEGLLAQGQAETAHGAAKRAQELFNSVGGAGEGTKAANELLDQVEALLRQQREKGQWGAIDPGTFMGDAQGFGGISRAVYTKLFAQTLHLPDRPYEIMLDAPMFQSLDAINASLARQQTQPKKAPASRTRGEGGGAGRDAPQRAEGQALRQVPLREEPRTAPPIVTPAVMGTDMLGGRTWDCPDAVHTRMLELAATGEIPVSKPEQRIKNVNKRPTFYGAPEWRDAVKNGYIHPDMPAPRGLKWRKVTMGWKLLAV